MHQKRVASSAPVSIIFIAASWNRCRLMFSHSNRTPGSRRTFLRVLSANVQACRVCNLPRIVLEVCKAGLAAPEFRGFVRAHASISWKRFDGRAARNAVTAVGSRAPDAECVRVCVCGHVTAHWAAPASVQMNKQGVSNSLFMSQVTRATKVGTAARRHLQLSDEVDGSVRSTLSIVTEDFSVPALL